MAPRMRYHSNNYLVSILEVADIESLRPIFEQVDVPPRIGYPIHFLVKRISELGSNAILNIFGTGEATGYFSILAQVAEKLDIGVPNNKQMHLWDDSQKSLVSDCPSDVIERMVQLCKSLEDGILLCVARRFYASLDPEKRLKFNQDIGVAARELLTDRRTVAAGAAGLMGLASAGGFGTYTLMSSLLHTISLGSLGFGAYTTASTVLSVALGPAGWTALGAYTLFALGSPKVSKMLPVIIAAALIRHRGET